MTGYPMSTMNQNTVGLDQNTVGLDQNTVKERRSQIWDFRFITLFIE